MWLLGVIGLAAGLVLGIYLYDVLSTSLANRKRELRDDETSRRARMLAKRSMEQTRGSGDDEADQEQKKAD